MTVPLARNWFALLALFLVGACETYQPLPLSERASLETDVPRQVKQVPRSELMVGKHRFDPSDGLDITEVAMIALANNSSLAVERAKIGVTRAQLYAAGLLPDPEFSAGVTIPDEAELTTGFDFGLSLDIRKLITRSASIGAADAALQQADLQLLWQEWQVVQQAKLLVVRRRYQDALATLLKTHLAEYTTRYNRAARALSAGTAPLDQFITAWVPLADARSRITKLERQINQTSHELNALLGLSPEVQLRLVDQGETVQTPPNIDKVLKTLPQRRPDLLALKAGYQSQDERVRQAILAQFPNLSVGVTGERDPESFNAVGLGITLSLPFFDANKGNIAIERATRESLRVEYQARLDQTRGEIDRLVAERRLLREHRASLMQEIADIEPLAQKARDAFDAGTLATSVFNDLEANLLEKRIDLLELEATLDEIDLGLQTLLWSVTPSSLAGETPQANGAESSGLLADGHDE